MYQRHQRILATALFLLLALLAASSAWATGLKGEQPLLLKTNLGDFSAATRIQTKSTVQLKVWEPVIQMVKRNYDEPFQKAFLVGPEQLEVEHDEIWRMEGDSGVSSAEKERYKGMFDIVSLYWKDGLIQAYTVERFYCTNPATGDRLTPGTHKLAELRDRQNILAKIKEEPMRLNVAKKN